MPNTDAEKIKQIKQKWEWVHSLADTGHTLAMLGENSSPPTYDRAEGLKVCQSLSETIAELEAMLRT